MFRVSIFKGKSEVYSFFTSDQTEAIKTVRSMFPEQMFQVRSEDHMLGEDYVVIFSKGF